MKTIETRLPGVFVIEPAVFEDHRGFFFESYKRSAFRAAGITADFVQDNFSSSTRHTLRGLHYQLAQAQAKVCAVTFGTVLDVVLDIRRGSPTFGQWTTVTLEAETHRQIFIPRGFAHGFVVLSDYAHFVYKCDAEYQAGDEYGIAWNDPTLAIDWRVTAPILSDRDGAFPALAEVPPRHLPVYEGAPA